MIIIKKPEEVEIMREGGKITARVLREVLKSVKEGVKTRELDRLAESLIEKYGGKPSFKMVKGYKFATCICVNEEVVHGIPTDYVLSSGDVLTVDLGVFYRGLHTDAAWTVRVQKAGSKMENYNLGPKNDKIGQFLKTGRLALEKAIKMAQVGNRVGDVSWAIQESVEKAGYSVVRALVGHGVGRKLHEDPPVPCFLKKKVEDTPRLQANMTLAIEVIYSLGKPEVGYKGDNGWSIVTQDGLLAALFEHSVAVTKKGPLVLTR